MFSKFKVEPGSHVLYLRGARRFELDSTNECLNIPILEFYDREIASLKARKQSLEERGRRCERHYRKNQDLRAAASRRRNIPVAATAGVVTGLYRPQPSCSKPRQAACGI